MTRGEAERGEGRRGREALEDAVEVAGVAEVLQPRGWARAGAPLRRRRRRLRGRGHHRLRGADAAGTAPPRESTRPPSSSSSPRSTAAAAAANSSDRIAHLRAPRRNGHRGEVWRSRRERGDWRRWQREVKAMGRLTPSNRATGRRRGDERGGREARSLIFSPLRGRNSSELELGREGSEELVQVAMGWLGGLSFGWLSG